MKECHQCKQSKPLSEFCKDKGKKDGLHSYCKTCNSRTAKERYASSSRFREEAACRALKWNKENPERRQEIQRKSSVVSRYKITWEEYCELRDSQYNLCAICQNPETRTLKGTVHELSVDHDHDTGKVRELLCHRCNTVVGLVEESPKTLRQIESYIRKHQ